LKTIYILYDSAVIQEPQQVANLPQNEQFNVDVYSNIWFPINFDAVDCARDFHLPIHHLIKKYYPEIKIQFITPENLSPNIAYIYPINFKYFHSTLKNKNLHQIFNQLNPAIQKSLSLKKACVLINDSHEYATYIDSTKALFSLPKSLNKRFWITSGNLDNERYIGTNLFFKQKLYNLLIKWYWNSKKSDVPIFGFRFFEEVVAFQTRCFYPEYSYQEKLMHLQKSTFKAFICLNNVIKSHRVVLTYLLHQNGLDKNFISLKKVPKDYYHELKQLGWSMHISTSKWENFTSKLPIVADEVTAEKQINPWDLIPFDLVNRSFFWLVTETLYDGTGLSRCFFTEKIYKPMSLFMPFVVVAQPFTLYNLKKEGYQTFSKWWDESYDLEVHPHKRMEKIVLVVKQIAALSNAELLSMYKEMESVLKHNYNRLYHTTAAKPFITQLVEQCLV
jgi:hypothetical protein